MAYRSNPGPELVQAVTAAWLVSVTMGTTIVLCFDGLMGLLILPLALPYALLLSMLVYVPGLFLATLFPEFILRHRASCFAGLPFAVCAYTCWRGGFDEPLMTACAVVDALLAGAWCFHFTGHLTDQG